MYYYQWTIHSYVLYLIAATVKLLLGQQKQQEQQPEWQLISRGVFVRQTDGRHPSTDTAINIDVNALGIFCIVVGLCERGAIGGTWRTCCWLYGGLILLFCFQ